LKGLPGSLAKELDQPGHRMDRLHSVDAQWLVEFEVDAIIPD